MTKIGFSETINDKPASHTDGVTADRLFQQAIRNVGASLISPLKNSISDRLFKNDEMQGARILRNEAYNQYAAMTKDEAQRSRSRFSTACYR